MSKNEATTSRASSLESLNAQRLFDEMIDTLRSFGNQELTADYRLAGERFFDALARTRANNETGRVDALAHAELHDAFKDFERATKRADRWLTSLSGNTQRNPKTLCEHAWNRNRKCGVAPIESERSRSSTMAAVSGKTKLAGMRVSSGPATSVESMQQRAEELAGDPFPIGTWHRTCRMCDKPMGQVGNRWLCPNLHEEAAD
jgi:hypothetical protein